jgi:hypothetical protein
MSPPPPARHPRFSSLKRLIRPDLLAWALILVAGFSWLISYEMRGGEAAPLLARWPRDAALPFDSHRYNLVMLAHPKCPCTRASLDELETVLRQDRGKINAIVCFNDPEDAPADWADTSLERAAKAIPGVHVILDRDGVVAKEFGAMTSGQVLMFDQLGHGIFSGGITGSRGHTGENCGRNLVLALAKGDDARPAVTPVFGCSIYDAPLAEADRP